MGFFNDETIKANLVFEMLGRPKEHLEKTMEDFVKQLEAEQGITVTKKKIHETKLLEQKQENSEKPQVKQELFSTFAEIEIETNKINNISMLLFKYMPSHIEIVSPDKQTFDNSELNNLLNEITSRLHNYDSIAKTALMHNKILAKKFLELKEGKKEEVKTETEVIEENKESEAVQDKPAKKKKTKKN